MPVEKESKIGQFIAALREWLPTVWVRLAEWSEACREQPILIWHTPAVRYATYAVGALILAGVVSWSLSLLRPVGQEAIPRARTADFRVICTDPECGHEFTINERFNFNKFPVKCPRCGQMSGQRAVKCCSEACKGKWVVPVREGDRLRCPRCGAVLGGGG